MHITSRLIPKSYMQLGITLFQLMHMEKVVEDGESERDQTLNLDGVLTRLTGHLELTLEDPEDAFNDISRLSMTEIEKLFFILRSEMLK